MEPKSRRPGEGSGFGNVQRHGHRSHTETLNEFQPLGVAPCDGFAAELIAEARLRLGYQLTNWGRS